MSNDHKKITIAIDGFSSCGKSTLAKALAGQLDYIFIDSGAMYRGVCLFALENGFIANGNVDRERLIAALPGIELRFGKLNDNAERPLMLNGRDVSAEIRSMEVSQNVSNVSTIKEVRQQLVHQQQELGRMGGVVMDGRDIGTVVFPDAALKLFLTASIDIRTERRYLEMTQKGQQVSLEEIAKNLQERDYIDSTRDESPLRKADDAIVIDNTELTPEMQLALALSLVKEAIHQELI